ncbi:MAG: heparinase [Terrimonas sp.]|nr:heparinase [Terrimonas sp.]
MLPGKFKLMASLTSIYLVFFSCQLAAQEFTSTRDRFPRPDYSFFYRDINLLRTHFPKEKINAIILPSDQWHPYPKAGDRKAWQDLSPDLRSRYIAQAEKNIDFDWPALKATDFMEYSINGNRSHYQAHSFQRTDVLYYLVMAECIEHKGRFMDAIVNGIWAICEESFWGVPAHLYLQNKGHTFLPLVNDPVCDLFAAEKAACLAWTYYLLGHEIDKVTPIIGQRIYDEVNRRIFLSTMEHDDWRWTGLKANMDRRVNNWDPWISSNWLACILILEKDPQKRSTYLNRLFQVLDQFINTQPEDGSCEEGPGYWTRAGASLFECLEMLNSASDGKVDLAKIPLIRNTGSYIYKVDIGHHYFFNYADADPQYDGLPANLIYRYGIAAGDPQLAQYGTWLMKEQDPRNHIIQNSFLRGLPELFKTPDYQKAVVSEPLPRDSWFPSNQLICARSQEGSVSGLFLAVKGNNNLESHNHNDVGNFIIYTDGYPAIIDVGKREYTGPGDSNPLREIYKNSAYHNLPLINGIEQGKGGQYRATDVTYKEDDAKALIAMNIAEAYPASAGVVSWKRTLELQRGRKIQLTESFELTAAAHKIDLMLMTNRNAEILKPGQMILRDPMNKSSDLKIFYDPKQLKPEIEMLVCDDAALQKNWGHHINRLVFHYLSGRKKDTIAINFTQ